MNSKIAKVDKELRGEDGSHAKGQSFTRLLALPFVLYALPLALSLAQGSAEDYDRSATYSSRTADRVFADTVVPHWFGDDDAHFWYRVTTGSKSHRFILVDARAGKRDEAFDHVRLAELLTKSSGQEIHSDRLGLYSLRFAADLAGCTFQFDNKSWTFQLPAGPLKEQPIDLADIDAGGLPAQSRIARSRGGRQRTPIQFQNRTDQDLEYFWVMEDGGLRSYGRVDAGKSAMIQTFDGHAWLLRDSADQPIASFVASVSDSLAVIDATTVAPRPSRTSEGRRRNSPPAGSPDGKWRVAIDGDHLSIVNAETEVARELAVPEMESMDADSFRYEDRVWWSPDSYHFVIMRVQPGENRTINLIESSPEDSIHARLLTIPYAKPGDQLDHPRPILFSKDNDWQGSAIIDTEFPNPFDLRDLAWDLDSRSFSFLYNERGHQRLRLIAVDAQSATPRVVIDEQSETFVCYSQKSFLHRIASTNEVIWMSERTGWNHLYLIDSVTGKVKHAITSGKWVVRDVERVDESQRQLYLRVSGIDPDQDPYQLHLIRVDFDGNHLTRLTEGDGNHRWSHSPHGVYLLDTYSRVDLPPVTELREVATGEKTCDLERADISRLLETGWQPPERFVAKGRDGETDIHGIIVRPTNFQADARYGVLEEIYAGPHSSFVPKDFGLHPSLYQMAELGFIVVKIDGMGTSNRSKAFHDVCWKNLGDSGFPDRIAWMKAAATERPEMDLTRVGIWGGSAGGQSAMRALIAHNDFYCAAVADCGCHDNRVDKIWWNEQWMGWPIGSHYHDQSNVTQAHLLQGDLMLIWGELDRNVDPASTMQVIDALVRADKDFEQLIIPGSGHGAAGHPYAKRRQADFFVRKLRR